jgi:hypothetical protein
MMAEKRVEREGQRRRGTKRATMGTKQGKLRLCDGGGGGAQVRRNGTSSGMPGWPEVWMSLMICLRLLHPRSGWVLKRTKRTLPEVLLKRPTLMVRPNLAHHLDDTLHPLCKGRVEGLSWMRRRKLGSI